MSEDTRREQEIEALFEKGGAAARSALTSARDATGRQAKIIIDLKADMAASAGGSVDAATVARWTAKVDEGVAEAAKIQEGFDKIGVESGTPLPEIPGYNPPISNIRPKPDQTLPGQPVVEPHKKNR